MTRPGLQPGPTAARQNRWRTHCVVGLDFRYFGEKDDTVTKLLSEFGTAARR